MYVWDARRVFGAVQPKKPAAKGSVAGARGPLGLSGPWLVIHSYYTDMYDIFIIHVYIIYI